MAQLSSTLTASTARANFYQILGETSDKLRQFTIKLRGKKDVVLLSSEDYAGWLETFDIMTDPKLVKSIEKGRREIKAGQGIPYAKAKKQLGW